jgi:hypothetical protein
MKRRSVRHGHKRSVAPDYQLARIQFAGVEVDGHRLALSDDEPERTSGRLPCTCGYFAWTFRRFARHLMLVKESLWLTVE